MLTFSDVEMLLEGSAYIGKSGFLVLAALPVTEFRSKVGDRFVIKHKGRTPLSCINTCIASGGWVPMGQGAATAITP